MSYNNHNKIRYHKHAASGANVNVKHMDGTPALSLAIRNTFTDAVKVLIAEGANIDVKYGLYVVFVTILFVILNLQTKAHGTTRSCIITKWNRQRDHWRTAKVRVLVQFINPIHLYNCRQNVNINLDNNRGETAHDLAIRLNKQHIADMLAAHLSHQLLVAED
jgi:ankyrin repeat protein